MKRSAAAVLGVAAVANPVAADSHTDAETTGGSGGSTSADAPYSDIERAIHAEVNRRRESRGLAPLAYNANIAAAAREYSRQMIAEDFFSHTARGESSFAAHYRDDGVDCSSLGENILYRTRSAESPEAVAANVVDQWMGSAGHRENVLGDWRSEGIGVAVTDDGVLYATQGFGSCPGTSDASGGGSGSGDGSSDSGSGDTGSAGDGSSDSGNGGGESSDDGSNDGGSGGSSGGSGDVSGDGRDSEDVDGGNAGSDDASGGGDGSADHGDSDWGGRWHHWGDDDPTDEWWSRTHDGSANHGEEKAVDDWCADRTASSD